jgi:hypothetical protein
MVLGRFSDIEHIFRHSAHHHDTTKKAHIASAFGLRTATARPTSSIIFIQIFAHAYHTTPALARRLFHGCYNGKGFNSPIAAAIRAKGKLIESIPLCNCNAFLLSKRTNPKIQPRHVITFN